MMNHTVPNDPLPSEKSVREILSTPVRCRTDVLVCGAGPAGCAAALAAAQCGVKTVLIESMPFAGGTPTASGVNGIGTWFWEPDGRVLIGGMPQKMIREMYLRSGGDAENLRRIFTPLEKAPDYRHSFGGCWIGVNPESVKLVLDDMLCRAGIDILFQTLAVMPVMEKNRVVGVAVESKSGRQIILADTVIDATGDGDLAARAGASFTTGRAGDGLCQPMSQIFVSLDAEYPNMYYGLDDKDPEPDELKRNRFRGAVAQARERGIIRENPNDIFCAATPLNSASQSVCAVNFTRIQKKSSCDAKELTDALIAGRRQVSESMNFIREYICGTAKLGMIYPCIGVRESRHINGDVTLTGQDVLSGRRFPDSIARGIYLMDIHNPDAVGKPSTLIAPEQPYDIPFGALLPKGIEGLAVAGRCLSADHEALSSCRIMSHCMAMGEAAGTAAALAARGKKPVREIDRAELRAELRANGANPG